MQFVKFIATYNEREVWINPQWVVAVHADSDDTSRIERSDDTTTVHGSIVEVMKKLGARE